MADSGEQPPHEIPIIVSHPDHGHAECCVRIPGEGEKDSGVNVKTIPG
jgi:hypothetical protein